MKRLLYACLAAAAAFAQSPVEGPDTFEVASIKPGNPLSNGSSMGYQPGVGLRIENATLEQIVESAYDLRDFQLIGAPAWMKNERYVIVAKGVLTSGPANYRDMSDAQRKAAGELMRTRLRKLLAERFQLVVHTETRELPMYALVVAKAGAKMQANTLPDGSPQMAMINRGVYKVTRSAMANVAANLAGITGRPVHDETGLTGFYDFELKWTPDAPAAAPDGVERTAEPVTGPTLFTALQEQLGLKLESKKGPVPVVVIDRVEHLTEN